MIRGRNSKRYPPVERELVIKEARFKSSKSRGKKAQERKPRGATKQTNTRRVNWGLVADGLMSIVGPGLCVVALLALFFVVPLGLRQFPVEKISITGDFSFVKKADLDAALSRYIDESFFTVSMSKIKKDAQAIPWVDGASVSRIWPGSLVVSITERVAIARWNDQQLISQRGALFEPRVIGGHHRLPRLYGEQSTAAEVMQRFQEITQVLRPLGLSLSELKMTPRRSWSIQLNNGINLLVDRADTMKKINKFAELYQQLDEIQPTIARVDLRYRNGMAVSWLDEAQNNDHIIGSR